MIDVSSLRIALRKDRICTGVSPREAMSVKKEGDGEEEEEEEEEDFFVGLVLVVKEERGSLRWTARTLFWVWVVVGVWVATEARKGLVFSFSFSFSSPSASFSCLTRATKPLRVSVRVSRRLWRRKEW